MTIFETEVAFDETSFKGEVFIGAQFKLRALFRGKKEDKLFTNGGVVDFRNAIFYRPDLIRFSQADFSRCILFETNVRGIDFTGVEWAESLTCIQNLKWKIWKQLSKRELSRSLLFKANDQVTDLCGVKGSECLTHFGNFVWKRLSRKCMYEPENSEPEVLESAYRQIRQSYEDYRNYPEAGTFYFGEMDNKRKRNSGIRRNFSLIGLYGLLSGYGQKPNQALFWLLFLLFLFTILLIAAGMKTAPGDHVQIFDFCTVFWAYTLKVVTYGVPLYFTPVSISGDFLTMLARILVPIQAALYILAVNRAFKR